MTDAAKTPPNAYLERGATFTPKEYEYLQMGLMAVAVSAEQEAQRRKDSGQRFDEQVRAQMEIVDLSKRLQQYQIAGQGVADEIMAAFKQQLEAAFNDGDSRRVGKAVADLIAILIRCEADPAKQVGIVTTQVMTNLVKTQLATVMAKVALAPFKAHIEKLMAAYRETKWPPAVDVMRHIVELLDYGIDRADSGNVPWEGLDE